MDDQESRLKLSARIVSHSHRLTPEAFALFSSGESSIRVDSVSSTSLCATVINPMCGEEQPNRFVHIAHILHSNFLIALNAASFGHFLWATQDNLLLPFTLEYPPPIGKERAVILKRVQTRDDELPLLTPEEVRTTALLVSALGSEEDAVLRAEYIKGVIHFALDVHDFEFHKDAFANFYRAFEHLVSSRILKKKKLSKELKEIKCALGSLGFPDQLSEAFTDVYRLRSEQVMHAQRQQIAVSRDDVLKIKACLDGLIYKIYQPIWLERLSEMNDA